MKIIYFIQIHIRYTVYFSCKTNTSFFIENRMLSIYFPKPISCHRMKNQYLLLYFYMLQILLLTIYSHVKYLYEIPFIINTHIFNTIHIISSYITPNTSFNRTLFSSHALSIIQFPFHFRTV